LLYLGVSPNAGEPELYRPMDEGGASGMVAARVLRMPPGGREPDASGTARIAAAEPDVARRPATGVATVSALLTDVGSHGRAGGGR
jgi:hypothetical protein